MKVASYIYLEKTNKDYLKKLSKEFHIPVSHILNSLVNSFKTGDKLKLKAHTPKYVVRAEAWSKKHKSA